MGNVANIAIRPMRVFFNGVDVGHVDGDIEVSISEDLVDVTAHAHGTNVLSQIRTGKQVEVTLSFKETSAAKIRELLSRAGESHTPTEAGATEVVGWGTSKDFTQTLADAKRLVLHPIEKPDTDKSQDYTFFKAYPMLETLTFSGENIMTIPVTFKVYPDFDINGKVRYFAFGDSTQNLSA